MGALVGGNLAAAAALGKKFTDDGPHLIYLPERVFEIDRFLADVKATHERYGRCVIAVSEGIHDAQGQPILAKLAKDHGLKEGEWTVPDQSIRDLIRYYTREAGVRSLERELGNLARKTVRDMDREKVASITIDAERLAKYAGVRKYRYGEADAEDQVGIVTGLAWTEFGGDILTNPDDDAADFLVRARKGDYDGIARKLTGDGHALEHGGANFYLYWANFADAERQLADRQAASIRDAETIIEIGLEGVDRSRRQNRDAQQRHAGLCHQQQLRAL